MITLREVGQTEKDKYHVVPLICGVSTTTQMNLSTKQNLSVKHSAYLTYMQNTLCEMPGWKDHNLESRLPGEISTISDDTILKAVSKEELKSLLMTVKEKSEKLA